MTLIYRNSPPSTGASTFHRRSEHLWRPCTRPLHPEYNERQYIQYVVPRKLSWPVESYTMRPTPTNWQRQNYMTYLMGTPACQPHSHRVEDERAAYTIIMIYYRFDAFWVYWSYEVTTLLSISKRKKRPNYWKMNKRNRGGDTHTSIYFDQGTIYNRICWNE